MQFPWRVVRSHAAVRAAASVSRLWIGKRGGQSICGDVQGQMSTAATAQEVFFRMLALAWPKTCALLTIQMEGQRKAFSAFL